MFLSYEGFELIANASFRVKNPGRTLQKHRLMVEPKERALKGAFVILDVS